MGNVYDSQYERVIGDDSYDLKDLKNWSNTNN